jgi:hypothetical protein
VVPTKERIDQFIDILKLASCRGECCGTCLFFLRGIDDMPSFYTEDGVFGVEWGWFCRRFPPECGDNCNELKQPWVDWTEWCGEWKHGDFDGEARNWYEIEHEEQD